MKTRNICSSTERLHHRVEKKNYSRVNTRCVPLQNIEINYNNELIQKNEAEKNIRMEIYDLIMEEVCNNTPIIEIINKLNSEQRYRKLGQYFEIWINDKLKVKSQLEVKILEERKKGKSNQEIIDLLINANKLRRNKKYIKKLVNSLKSKEDKGIEIEHE